MDATPHLVVGAALTGRMPRLMAFATGVASHLVLDAIPHDHYAWITGVTWMALLDLGVGMALVVVVARRGRRGALAGALGAVFPEVTRLDLPYDRILHDLFGRLPHHEVHGAMGLATQVAVVLVALAGILLSRHPTVPKQG